jgi:hypothetical protein
MKTQIQKEEVKIDITPESKTVEILAWINGNWDNFDSKEEMCKYLEDAYIFGPLGESEHRLPEVYMSLINEVELEKNPIINEVVV